MDLDEILSSPVMAEFGKMMLNESKMRTERKYMALNGLAEMGHAVMTGDSIVEYFPLSEFFKAHIYNRGISGDTSGELKKRYSQTVLPLKPSLTFIWIGTNDLQDEVPLDEIAANVEEIASGIEKNGSRVAIISVAPVNETSNDGNIRNTVGKRKNKDICSLNRLYKSLCSRHGWDYIDIYTVLQKNDSMPDELSEDGLHPNIAGYIPVANEIMSFLK